MIKQLPSSQIKSFVKDNPNCVLLDVRTKEEWRQGKPDGEKIGLKTYFLSLQFEGRVVNKNFLEEFNNLNIDKKTKIIVMCGSGGRSQRSAELLAEQGYHCLNISDGFNGNNQEPGWRACGLDCS